MGKQEKTTFKYEPSEHPDGCPKCGGEAEFDQNEESEGEYEITRIVCTKCDFAWIEYYRFEKWEPSWQSEEGDEDKE